MARLLYLAKRVAPDILLVVSVLAGRVNNPTFQDWDRLDRVYRYINSTSNRVINYWKSQKKKVTVESYIDASFACHDDMKSRTGCILLCCGNIVGAWTSKQGQNVKSSTEAELVGLSDECTWVIWAQHFLEGQGYQKDVPIIFQDNTSVKDILKRGPSAQQRTRHLNVRQHFVGDLMKRGEVEIQYCESEQMLADMLTKPLMGGLFKYLRDAVVTVI